MPDFWVPCVSDGVHRVSYWRRFFWSSGFWGFDFSAQYIVTSEDVGSGAWDQRFQFSFLYELADSSGGYTEFGGGLLRCQVYCFLIHVNILTQALGFVKVRTFFGAIFVRSLSVAGFGCGAGLPSRRCPPPTGGEQGKRRVWGGVSPSLFRVFLLMEYGQ